MLIAYRRHLKSCPHRDKGRIYRRCRRPIWVQGTLAEEPIRKSIGIRNWEQAQALISEWEANGHRDEQPQAVRLQDACKDFLADAEARKLSEATRSKFQLLFKQLKAFAADQGVRHIDEFNLALLRKFRSSWRDSSISALKKLERLRAFFRFTQKAGWIAENPASRIKNPTVTQRPTMPFTQDQMVPILSAVDEYPDGYGLTGQANAVRLRAFVLLLRYSGLGIGDAVTLRRDRLEGIRLFLYTAKTQVPVYCPLPDFVVEALESCPGTHPDYFFWTGASRINSAVGDWQRSLRKLFAIAGIDGGHAHRFRDTFAVELLLKGVPLERVSVLLGHRSVKVTEKHYAPWVRARQEQVEADVRRTWGEDPLVLSETKGTPEVHEKEETVN